MSATRRIVIIGAGHGGVQAAASLREEGYEGPIALISDDPNAPYQRPPLSKAWLKGEANGESLALRPEASYATQGIELRLSTRASSRFSRSNSVTVAPSARADAATSRPM